MFYGYESTDEQITSGRGDSSLLVENNNKNIGSYIVSSTDLLSLINDHAKKITHIKIDIEESIYLIIDDIKSLIRERIIISFYVELTKKKEFLKINNELLKYAKQFGYDVLIDNDKDSSSDYILNRI